MNLGKLDLNRLKVRQKISTHSDSGIAWLLPLLLIRGTVQMREVSIEDACQGYAVIMSTTPLIFHA